MVGAIPLHELKVKGVGVLRLVVVMVSVGAEGDLGKKRVLVQFI